MMAAIGRQLKQSVNVFHNLMLYRRLPMPTNIFSVTWTTKTTTSHTLIVKTVYPVDAGTLVISSQDEEVFGVFDLIREE